MYYKYCIVFDSMAFYLLFAIGFRSEMKRSNADKLSTTVDSQKHEIKMLLEPTKGSGGIIVTKNSTSINIDKKVIQCCKDWIIWLWNTFNVKINVWIGNNQYQYFRHRLNIMLSRKTRKTTLKYTHQMRQMFYSKY